MVRRHRVAAVALALVLAGCGRDAQPRHDTAGPVWVPPECPTGGWHQQERGGIPDGFAVDHVLLCRGETRAGRSVVVTVRADTPTTELLALLRRPSDPLTDGACPAVAVFPPYFLLVDARGRSILPAVPTDGCGLPRDEVSDAVGALSYRTVAQTPLTRPGVLPGG